MRRIYDAAFATQQGSEHWHLGTFWWIDDSRTTGSWTRAEAYTYVANHDLGDVYVNEDGYKVSVRAYYNSAGTQWIQTEADGVKRDNLTTLAIRHRQGLPNT